MKCENVSELLIEYIKGELNNEQSTAVETHLQNCEKCRKEMRLLHNAFYELKNFIAIDISCDISAVAEKARQRMKSKTKFLQRWWMTALAGVAALIVFFVMNSQPRPSTSVAKDVVPVVNTANNDNKPKDDNKIKESPKVAKKTEKTGKVIIAANPRIIKRHSKKSIHIQLVQPENIKIEDKPILVAHLDALTQYLISADDNRAINCSILPIVATDNADQAVADTLTATMICKLRDQFGSSAVNRSTLLNVAGNDMNDIVNEAKKGFISGADKDHYLIVGTVMKAKSGYLFSVNIINGADNSIVNGNNHPVLIPDDNFRTADLIKNTTKADDELIYKIS